MPQGLHGHNAAVERARKACTECGGDLLISNDTEVICTSCERRGDIDDKGNLNFREGRKTALEYLDDPNITFKMNYVCNGRTWSFDASVDVDEGGFDIYLSESLRENLEEIYETLGPEARYTVRNRAGECKYQVQVSLSWEGGKSHPETIQGGWTPDSVNYAAITNILEMDLGALLEDEGFYFESKRKQARQKVAHDSGDGATIYHCCFCGGGNVIARSDGTTECGYCQTAFTVQVQPMHPNMPQTDPATGQPINNADMPGQPGVPGEVPSDQSGSSDPGVFEPPGAAAPAFVPPEQPALPVAASSRFYITAKGVALDEDAFLRHIAIAHADDREKVIEQVRQSRLDRAGVDRVASDSHR
jgi:uncharacterized Zn finger protein (UPF0148 family)